MREQLKRLLGYRSWYMAQWAVGRGQWAVEGHLKRDKHPTYQKNIPNIFLGMHDADQRPHLGMQDEQGALKRVACCEGFGFRSS